MKRKLNLLLIISMLLMSLAACGSAASDSAATESVGAVTETMDGGSYSNDMYMYEDALYDTEVEMEESMEQSIDDSAAETTGNTQQESMERKLITTMHIGAETEQFHEFIQNVEARVAELGGYVESSEQYQMYSQLWAANYKIRVPESRLEEFTGLVAQESNVVSNSRQVDDVTLTYVDLESRKEVLMAEQDRLIEMLSQAQDIETILAIETRLSEVQGNIESMEAQLRTYDNAIQYSTVYLYIEEVEVFTVVEQEEKTAWEEMTEGFVNSLKKVGLGLRNFAVGFVVYLPYLAVAAVVILMIGLIIRGIVKAIIKRNEKKKKSVPSYLPVMMPYGGGFVAPPMTNGNPLTEKVNPVQETSPVAEPMDSEKEAEEKKNK